MRRISLFAILVASLALAGCNTVRGLGRDLESVADAGDEVM